MGRGYSYQEEYRFGGNRFPGRKYLSRFGCPQKIVTNNAQAFKSMAMISFFQKYNIVLDHSTTYYPQGNGMAESSNKSLINIIKKVLNRNKRS
jgi:transposase InsO family protein